MRAFGIVWRDMAGAAAEVEVAGIRCDGLPAWSNARSGPGGSRAAGGGRHVKARQ